MIVRVREAPVQTDEQRFVHPGVPWESYVAIGNALADRNVRITYDRGAMELMTTSYKHERGGLIGHLLGILALEMNINVISGGRMTFQREELERGLEPDDCFWIEHVEKMRGKSAYDQENDPPPDLGVEVEVSRSVLNRLGIYAAMRVPEVWRWDGESLRILLLQEDGTYAEAEKSLAFSFLPVAELARFLAMWETHTDTETGLAFRDWVREQMQRGWKAE